MARRKRRAYTTHGRRLSEPPTAPTIPSPSCPPWEAECVLQQYTSPHYRTLVLGACAAGPACAGRLYVPADSVHPSAWNVYDSL
jgi:hypothetical protein